MERDPRTYQIIGAAMAVHQFLGSGFLEVVYQRALAIQFDAALIPYQREVKVPVSFHDKPSGTFRADFLCFDRVLVEIKAAPFATRRAVAQLSHYLRASGLAVGVVLNFGLGSLEFQRVVAPTKWIPPDAVSGQLPP